MANKNKKFEFRVDEEFFNGMEVYKNKHNINWSSKIRAFIESEIKNDVNSIQEVKKVKSNPHLDKYYSYSDFFEYKYNSNYIVEEVCSSFDNELGKGFQIILLTDDEKIKFLDFEDEEDDIEDKL